MKFLILVLSAASIVAYESPIYRQGEWNVRDENATPQDDQFYEGFFETRIDHFKPLNQNLTTFVSLLCFRRKKNIFFFYFRSDTM